MNENGLHNFHFQLYTPTFLFFFFFAFLVHSLMWNRPDRSANKQTNQQKNSHFPLITDQRVWTHPKTKQIWIYLFFIFLKSTWPPSNSNKIQLNLYTRRQTEIQLHTLAYDINKQARKPSWNIHRDLNGSHMLYFSRAFLTLRGGGLGWFRGKWAPVIKTITDIKFIIDFTISWRS